MSFIEKEVLKEMIRENVKTLYRKTLEHATPEELYQAAVFAIRDVITDKWMKTHDEYYEKDVKVVYYMSMEFLMGRSLKNSVFNLGIKDAFTEGGIIEGIKRIGFVILDAILAPMQGFLEMIEGVTGLKIAGKGVEWIAGMREKMESATRVEKKKPVEQKEEDPEIETPEIIDGNDPTGSTLGTVGSNSESSGKVRSITVNVEKLVERFEIHTTNMQGDMSRVKDMVSEALLSALNDVNLAI